MPHRYSHIIATAGAGFLGGLILALARTALSTLDNAYLSYGFYRTVVYIFSSELARFLIPAVVVVAAITVITAVWSRIRGFTGRTFSGALGLLTGLAVFLWQGYVYNRFKLPVTWRNRRELLGVDLPEPLFQWQVWKTNVLIAAGAIAVGLIVWLIAGTALRGPRSLGYRFWHAMGRPFTVTVMFCLVAGSFLAEHALRRGLAGLPNIILVSLDALRAEHLGCYGYSRDTSPEMDSLAANGIRFEWAISQAATTLPSHMSTLTSLYPTVHGVRMGRRMAGWRLTLAEYLRERGYRTAGCADGAFMSGSYGFRQGFEVYEDLYKGAGHAVPMILHWIDTRLADGPFFVLFHTYDVHSPYDPPEPWNEMFTNPDYDGAFEPTSADLERIRRQVESDPDRGHGLSQDDIDFTVGRYDGGIRYVDHWIGILVRGLKERGLLESTWVVITSDHGEEFAEHGSFLHGKLYLTCTHVPLIMAVPGAAEKRRKIPEIVELLDLMPTFLELAGVSAADTLQGKSLLPLIDGQPPDWDNIAFSETDTRGSRRAVISPTLHIITSLEYGELEIYDYHADPLEQVELNDPSRAAEIRDLARLLREWIRAQILLAERQDGTEEMETDRRVTKDLRSLGYAD